MGQPGLEAFGRFSEPALLILISLADGPKHGYAIQDDIEGLARVRPGPGTLYGALARLERQGFVEPLPSVDRRQPYRLTDNGATALRSQLAELHQLTATGLERLQAGVPA